MNYYTISLSAEPSVIGVNNGVHQAKFEKKNFTSEEDYEKFDHFFYELDYDYNQTVNLKKVPVSIKEVNLYAKAKVTDFMGFTPEVPDADFLVNERIKGILSECKLLKYLLFPTKVKRKNTKENYTYYFFYYPGIDFETVIFEKSELYNREISGGEVKDTLYKIKNLEHYKKLYRRLLSPGFSKICIDSKYKKYDCITILSDTFVSEKLKNLIGDNPNSGIEFGERCELIFD